MCECLAAHAVLLPCTSEFEAVLAGKLNCAAYVVLSGDFDDTENRGLIQVAGIVREPTTLFEGHRRRARLGNENCWILLNGIRRKDEIAFLFLERRGGI